MCCKPSITWTTGRPLRSRSSSTRRRVEQCSILKELGRRCAASSPDLCTVLSLSSCLGPRKPERTGQRSPQRSHILLACDARQRDPAQRGLSRPRRRSVDVPFISKSLTMPDINLSSHPAIITAEPLADSRRMWWECSYKSTHRRRRSARVRGVCCQPRMHQVCQPARSFKVADGSSAMSPLVLEERIQQGTLSQDGAIMRRSLVVVVQDPSGMGLAVSTRTSQTHALATSRSWRGDIQ